MSPWHVDPDHPECDGFAVVKDDDGTLAGCHETEEAAQRQLAALYANESSSSEDEEKSATTRPGHKALPLAGFKADGKPGEFTADFSVFDILDRDGDIVRKGAFLPAFEQNPNPAVVWTHRWDLPPIGETIDVDETDKGARGHGRLFVDEHDVARQVFAGLKSGALRQFSYSYDLAKDGFHLRDPEDGETPVRPDGKVQELTGFAAVHEWGPTLVGSNPATELLSTAKAFQALLGVTPPAHPHITSGSSANTGTAGMWLHEPADLELVAKALKAGARNNATDLERLQAIHDYAVENGAKCAKAGRPNDHERPDPELALALMFATPHPAR